MLSYPPSWRYSCAVLFRSSSPLSSSSIRREEGPGDGNGRSIERFAAPTNIAAIARVRRGRGSSQANRDNLCKNDETTVATLLSARPNGSSGSVARRSACAESAPRATDFIHSLNGFGRAGIRPQLSARIFGQCSTRPGAEAVISTPPRSRAGGSRFQFPSRGTNWTLKGST